MTLLCDFCCHAPMVAFYPCQSRQVVEEKGLEGVEGWTACDTCHTLIESGDIEALARRAYSFDQGDATESSRINYYRAQFVLFFDSRTGPAYREDLEDAIL